MAKGNKVQASAANNTAVAAPKTKASKAEFKILQTVEVAPAKLHTGKFLGRSAPHDEATLVERADSIRRNGQQQPIQARAIPGTDEYDVVFGNARTGAGILIVNGYKNGEGKDVKPDPDFKLRVEVVDVDDETAFLCNVVENSQRTQCSPIDNALNQEELRTKYGMSDVMIAKHYGYASSASVSRLKKLLTLEDEYRKNVHDGILTQAAAFLFCDVPEGEPREKVWLKAVDKAGKDEDIGSTEMAAAIKEWRKEEKEAKATAAATGGGDQQQPTGDQQQPTETPAQPEVPAGPGRPATGRTSMTLKEFKDLVGEIAADPDCPAVVEQAMGHLLSVISREMEPGDFAKWFASNLIGGDIAPEKKTEGVSAEDSFDANKNPRASDVVA